MTLSRILLASVAALTLVSASAWAGETPPEQATAVQPAPEQAAAVQPAPEQAAAVQPAPAQAVAAQPAPVQATLPSTPRKGDLDNAFLAAVPTTPLTGDQIVALMTERARFKAGPQPEEMAAVVVPFSLFLFLFLTVTIGLYFGTRKDRERHETLRVMIERGASIPPELLAPPAKKYSDLRRGLILVAGGLGLSIFVGATPVDNGIWTVGFIPILIGTGYLIAWKLTRLEPQPIRDEAAIAAEQEVNNL